MIALFCHERRTGLFENGDKYVDIRGMYRRFIMTLIMIKYSFERYIHKHQCAYNDKGWGEQVIYKLITYRTKYHTYKLSDKV